MTHRSNLIVDIVAIIVYVVVANPAATGLAVHEWVGLGLVFVFLVHCMLHFDWILATLRRHAEVASVANFVLDAAALVVFMTATVSGLMVSRHLLPMLGLVAPGYYFWNPLHSISAKLLLALLLIHTAVHWKWFALLPRQWRDLRCKPVAEEITGSEV